MQLVAKVGVVAALLLVPSVAQAICGRAAPIRVWPHRGIAVPTNARIAVSAPAQWRNGAELTVVSAPSSDPTRWTLKLSPRSWTSGGVERLELQPLLRLPPSTAYELRTSRGEVVGVFTTSVMADTRAPTWAGLKSAHLARPARGVVQLECGSDLIRAEAVAAATDDQTARDDIRYELWAGKPGAPLNYADPPLTWTTTPPAAPFALAFGNTDDALTDFELPKERPLRIGIKAVDLAGNESAASELTLD